MKVALVIIAIPYWFIMGMFASNPVVFGMWAAATTVMVLYAIGRRFLFRQVASEG